jgi:hypothetical protein
MKVDRSKFEQIVGNLLKQQPTSRKDERTGKKTSGTIIPPRMAGVDRQSVPVVRDRQPKSDRSTEKL